MNQLAQIEKQINDINDDLAFRFGDVFTKYNLSCESEFYHAILREAQIGVVIAAFGVDGHETSEADFINLRNIITNVPDFDLKEICAGIQDAHGDPNFILPKVAFLNDNTQDE